MIQKISLIFNGVEPVFIVKGHRGPRYTYETHYGLFYPFRRLQRMLQNWQTKRYLKTIGVTPYKCEGCGDGWAEFSIEDPNELLGTYKKTFVCMQCVSFYDWKNTHKRLYNEPVDFRR
jgi:hypothetical protein